VEVVPAAVGLLPVGGESGGVELGDAVVDGDEDCEGEEDDECPEARGCGEGREGRGVTAEDGFRDEQQQAEGVPEWHHEAELRGEEAEDACLGLDVELTHGGVDEGGDGELDANHEADGEDGDDIENSHEGDTRVGRSGFAWLLLDGGGEEDLLGRGGGEGVEGELAGGLRAEFEEEIDAAGSVGVDGVDEAEPGGAVEVGGVGDGEEDEVELACCAGCSGCIGLGDEGQVDGTAGGEGRFGGEDVGGGGGVGEGVGEELGVGDRDGW